MVFCAMDIKMYPAMLFTTKYSNYREATKNFQSSDA